MSPLAAGCTCGPGFALSTSNPAPDCPVHGIEGHYGTDEHGTTMAWSRAFSHGDGTLCLYNPANGCWYTDNDGATVQRVRTVCDRPHELSEPGR